MMAVAALNAGAQTMYEAITYCDNNYYGTARSMALGNAMVAVGGDLGSVGINPAGSAVAGYSQFTLTPSVSISSMTASYSPVAGMLSPTGTFPDSQYRFTMPNVGIMLNFDTGRNYGIKNYTFGFISNSTNIYLDRMNAFGNNSKTSMMGEHASFLDGIPDSDFFDNRGYWTDDAFYMDYNWRDVLARKCGMVSSLSDGSHYIGASEIEHRDGTIGLPDGGVLKQAYNVRHYGSKQDLLFNFAFNASDKLFVGFNLGIPTFSYNEFVSRAETPVDPSKFEYELDGVTTRLQHACMEEFYSANGTGIYASAGAIWLPVAGLRLGASVKTPTLMTVTEHYRYEGICERDGIKPKWYDTPDGDYTYDIHSPFQFTLGAAYTFDTFAMLSFDWERTNFRSMAFSSVDSEFGLDDYADANYDIRNNAGASNQFRAGIEIRPLPYFSFRGGFCCKMYDDIVFNDVTNTVSAGIGYSSAGSFFADFAFRHTTYPERWYYPYEDYADTASPEINLKKNIMDIAVTVGWRF